MSADFLTTLADEDVRYIVSRLPRDIRDLMTQYPKLVLAGGFIRAVIAGEEASDIDLFGPTQEYIGMASASLQAVRPGHQFFSTGNAMTLTTAGKTPVQFITRWTYEEPHGLLRSFDFTIAKAGVYFKAGIWHGLCHVRFYRDLAAKRLHYTSPVRNEDAGGSILRVQKFLSKGYRIAPESLGAVIARLVMSLDWGKLPATDDNVEREAGIARVLTALMREVDPLTLVDGVEATED